MILSQTERAAWTGNLMLYGILFEKTSKPLKRMQCTTPRQHTHPSSPSRRKTRSEKSERRPQKSQIMHNNHLPFNRPPKTKEKTRNVSSSHANRFIAEPDRKKMSNNGGNSYDGHRSKCNQRPIWYKCASLQEVLGSRGSSARSENDRTIFARCRLRKSA